MKCYVEITWSTALCRWWWQVKSEAGERYGSEEGFDAAVGAAREAMDEMGVRR